LDARKDKYRSIKSTHISQTSYKDTPNRSSKIIKVSQNIIEQTIRRASESSFSYEKPA
jgi:hypothetical protein